MRRCFLIFLLAIIQCGPIVIFCQEQAIEPKAGDTSRIKIASFNIRVFSDRSRSDAELRDIAQLVVGFDLIAIQETRDLPVVERLIRILKTDFGLSYQFSNSPPLGRGSREIYVFLWRVDRLKTLTELAVDSDPEDGFSREPAYQAFAVISPVNQSAFDFVLIDFHAIYGNASAERQAEAAKLPQAIERITQRVQQTPILAHEADFMLAGDFNLSCQDPAFSGLRSLGFEPIIPGLGTTIHDSPFDNIWYKPVSTSEYRSEWGMLKFDQTMFDGNDIVASRSVSDHRPIWAVFANGPDDD